MFPKNHSTMPRVVPSYFKLNPNKEKRLAIKASFKKVF
jgi:hypothetical protein